MAGEHMKSESCCILTMLWFTTLRGFNNAWRILDSENGHPPYSPDLAQCDFFLSSTMKQACAGQSFDTIDNLFMGVNAFLGGLSADFLHTVFQNGYGNCSYAVRAENTLNQHYKM
jgi:hypothetical protein